MDDVRVWWTEATQPSHHTVALLNIAERARMEAFRQDRDRALFVSAHVLLRRLVADDAGGPVASVDVVQQCDRCGQAHGQPRVFIAGKRGPAVSLAHADGVVVAALGALPVGVDLEPTGRVDATVAAVILSDRERTDLEAVAPVDRPEAMTRAWVRKEALLKAAGTGLLSDPRGIVLSQSGGPAITVEWASPGPWAVADLELAPGFEAAVAVQGTQMPPIVVRQVEPAVVS